MRVRASWERGGREREREREEREEREKRRGRGEEKRLVAVLSFLHLDANLPCNSQQLIPDHKVAVEQ